MSVLPRFCKTKHGSSGGARPYYGDHTWLSCACRTGCTPDYFSKISCWILIFQWTFFHSLKFFCSLNFYISMYWIFNYSTLENLTTFTRTSKWIIKFIFSLSNLNSITKFDVLQCQKTILQVSVDWHYFIRDPFCFASLVILAYLIKRCAIRDGKSQFSVLQLFYIIIRVTIKLGFSDI